MVWEGFFFLCLFVCVCSVLCIFSKPHTPPYPFCPSKLPYQRTNKIHVGDLRWLFKRHFVLLKLSESPVHLFLWKLFNNMFLFRERKGEGLEQGGLADTKHCDFGDFMYFLSSVGQAFGWGRWDWFCIDLVQTLLVTQLSPRILCLSFYLISNKTVICSCMKAEVLSVFPTPTPPHTSHRPPIRPPNLEAFWTDS